MHRVVLCPRTTQLTLMTQMIASCRRHEIPAFARMTFYLQHSVNFVIPAEAGILYQQVERRQRVSLSFAGAVSAASIFANVHREFAAEAAPATRFFLCVFREHIRSNSVNPRALCGKNIHLTETVCKPDYRTHPSSDNPAYPCNSPVPCVHQRAFAIQPAHDHRRHHDCGNETG